MDRLARMGRRRISARRSPARVPGKGKLKVHRGGARQLRAHARRVRADRAEDSRSKRDSRFAPAIGIALVAALASGGVLAQASAPAAPPATPPAAAPAQAPDDLRRLRRRPDRSATSSRRAKAAAWVPSPAASSAASSATRSAAAPARRVATIAGAGGGAYAGHQVEKNVKKKSYLVGRHLKMDSGQTRTFTYSSEPAVKEGERVKLVDGGKRLALIAK